MGQRKTAVKNNSTASTIDISLEKRAKISQSDVPAYSLSQALRVLNAIADNYALKPTTPLRVAQAMEMAPTSSSFRMLTGAAIAYGLTEGGYNASEILVTQLGRRIVKPIVEGDDRNAMVEAFLRPRIIKEFLSKYDGSQLPKEQIAKNVLEDLGVPSDRCDSIFSSIVDGAKSLNLLRDIKGKLYIDISAGGDAEGGGSAEVFLESPGIEDSGEITESIRDEYTSVLKSVGAIVPKTAEVNRRVFVTHGKNKDFVEPIKKLLSFGELEPIVSVEKQSVSQPVPEKVMTDMRSCGAAIIHVEDELRLIAPDTQEHVVLNPNVLIEIGAAMALYGKRFILLVKDGVKLPSNLQGLYEVRYSGETLDGDATIRLLYAINEMKKIPAGSVA
ncbi:TIR domain-containing protein [Chitinimonas sp. BJYL2]|uniref:TIR domain-containing protein n=1 Tax=Chitinimonas sp. BJYL2 TaxID=2976696 RepID=UPI0022B31BF6|nr:TIR domain-containing protein [Chitinimonas sp. BJYL2]